MKVNSLTAAHVLKYLLACEGLQSPYGPIPKTWRVFTTFLDYRSESSKDVASVQIGPVPEGDGTSFQMIWARLLTDDASGLGPVTLILQMQHLWDFEQAPALEAIEYWSSDYHSTGAFVRAVERDESFERLLDAPDPGAEVVEDYEEEHD